MPSSSRSEIAKLWRQGAQLTRKDVFGPDDPLRPVYERPSSLDWQIDVAAPGMVGSGYRSGGVAILSINPAGGSPKSRSDLLSDRMYEKFKGLRGVAQGRQALDAFEASNEAFIASMRHWGSMTRYLELIQQAMKWRHENIAYLYVVPFRTRGDKGSQMERTIRGRDHIEKGYQKHLKGQLDLLSPGRIVAMDKPSNNIAERYRDGALPTLEVVYFPRKRDAHSERREVLDYLAERTAGVLPPRSR